MKSFEYEVGEEPIPFQVTGELFHAVHPNRLPANTQLRYTDAVGKGQLYEGHIRFFKDSLVTESIKPFLERLDSKEKPITLRQMADIANWLIGDVYSGNPTEESKLT